MSSLFTIEFARDEDTGEFVNNVFDADGELVTEYKGESAADTFKHALYDQWPLLFAELFKDYFEWKQDHQTIEWDEEE
jgi:hypothetical protein